MKRFPIHINPRPVYSTRYHKYNTKLTSHFTPKTGHGIESLDNTAPLFGIAVYQKRNCAACLCGAGRLRAKRDTRRLRQTFAPIPARQLETRHVPRTTRRSRKANNHAPHLAQRATRRSFGPRNAHGTCRAQSQRHTRARQGCANVGCPQPRRRSRRHRHGSRVKLPTTHLLSTNCV